MKRFAVRRVVFLYPGNVLKSNVTLRYVFIIPITMVRSRKFWVMVC